MAKKTLYDKADKKIQRLASTIGAVLVIIGAISGAFAWISGQVQATIAFQISDFQNETRDANLRNEQAVTRVELMMLIEHDPENTVAIEQMAKHYFQDLGGNKYMTGKYSTWAREYGGDTTIVVGDK